MFDGTKRTSMSLRPSPAIDSCLASRTSARALGGGAGGIAHFAHLGGFLGAWIYLKVLQARSPSRQWQKKAAVKPRIVEGANSALERWRRISREGLHPVNRDELDRVLDKISATGLSSLTPSERDFLERFSARS
jgi:hypothetical protein